MAALCAVCGSADTGAMLDTYVCHNCGAVTNYRGELVAAETTDPAEPQPLVVTVGPADLSDPANPVRVSTWNGPDGPVTEEVAGDPGAFDRVAVVGSGEYDELHAVRVVTVPDAEKVPTGKAGK